ncbi:MAG: hypothetical protein IJR29_05455 [Butyrivibrio sp.]|nr:hypothetical protein [Butyrivibrio sp.]
MEYSSEYKKSIIELWNKIGAEVAKAFNLSVAKDAYGIVIGEIQSDLLVFSKNITLMYDFFSVYSETNLGLISTNEKNKKCILMSLNKVMSLALSIMEYFNKTIEDEDARNTDIYDCICDLFGEISMILRHDIPSPPMENKEESSVLDICKQMVKLGNTNGDVYTLNKFWFFTGRKHLPSIAMSDTAIVMQGPILYEDNFTIETLMYYRKIYPDTPIILSTWMGEADMTFKFMAKAISVDILENEKPVVDGKCNVKLQIVSSLNGINMAAENKKVKYVLKTRTDQRFFLPDFLKYMKDMIITFPVQNKKMRNRIEFLGGYSSHLTFPFRITDFMTFGNITDLIAFYSSTGEDERINNTYATVDNTEIQYEKVFELVPDDNLYAVMEYDGQKRKQIVKNIGKFRDPESYLAGSFYERFFLHRKFNDEDDELLHYWIFLKECAIILDPNQLMFYWNKYDSTYVTNNFLLSDGGLTSSAWHAIYHHEFA